MNHHKEVAGRLALAAADLRVAMLDAARAGDHLASKAIDDLLIKLNVLSQDWRKRYERQLASR